MKEISLAEVEAFASTGSKEFICVEGESLSPEALAVFAEKGIRVMVGSECCDDCDCEEDSEDECEEGGCCGGHHHGHGGHGGCCGGSDEEDELGYGYEMATKAPDGRAYLPEHLDLFYSESSERLKYEICDIGRRLWEREYTDGNGGNISVRVGPNEFICTPTGVSKGFLSPDMLCMVDGDGLQIAGALRRTSEITTHLAIFRSTPAAKSVCHAHPVHATAFAVAGVTPPPRLIPEWEVFAGNAVLAPYMTPGSKEMSDVIEPLAPLHQSILMGNHGVICWGTSVEDAYFKMEITDAYCRTVFVAMQIPSKRTSIPAEKLVELLAMKKNLGLPDARHGFTAEQLFEMEPWDFMHSNPMVFSGKDAEILGEEVGKLVAKELEASVEKIAEAVAKKIAAK